MLLVVIRIWLLLFAVAIAATVATPLGHASAEIVELVELDEAVTESVAPSSPPSARMLDSATTVATLPASPPVATIFRPPRAR